MEYQLEFYARRPLRDESYCLKTVNCKLKEREALLEMKVSTYEIGEHQLARR
jgi:hypothetical protein